MAYRCRCDYQSGCKFQGSYGPYCRALAERICIEESFHLKYGHDNVVFSCNRNTRTETDGTGSIKQVVASIMHFFGHSDKISVHTETLMRWKVKMASNDYETEIS